MSDDELLRLRRDLDLVKRQLRDLGAQQPVRNGRYPKAGPTTWYDVEDWVIGFMQDTLERRASNIRRWCPQWYDHPEVALRFRLLYESYHQILGRFNALSYSTWLLEHLDPHLDLIFSEDGPFASCSPDRHSPHRGLTITRNPNAEAYWGERPPRPSYHPSPAQRSPAARAIRP